MQPITKIITVITLSISALFTANSFATTLTADGIAECKFFKAKSECKAQAEKSALESLASQLYVQVESQTDTQQDNQGGNLFEFSAKTQTNIKLIGAETSCYYSQLNGDRYDCAATMESTRSAQLYQAELNRVASVINTQYSGLSSSLSSSQLIQLNTLLNELQTFEKLSTVYGLLQPSAKYPKLSVNSQEIQTQLNQLQQQPESLAQLAQLLSQAITYNKIFIAAPQLIGSQEVTPFGDALYQMLKSNIKVAQQVPDIEQLHQRLNTVYQVNDKHMDITFNLTDTEGNNLFTRIWQLKPAVYKQWRTKPLLLDFDRLLHQGYVVNKKFNVEVQTNKGKRNVIFQEGENAKILVKLNKSGYIYILGHSKNETVEQSYLLELTDEEGVYAFELYIGPEQMNKWIDISDGGFEILPPFGIEALEVFASESSFIKAKALPNARLIGDYYIVSQNLKKAVTLTRGLKKRKSKKTQTSEAVLMINTIAK